MRVEFAGIELLGARFSVDAETARQLAGALSDAADELDAGVTYPPNWGADPNDPDDMHRAAEARRRGNA